MKKQNPPVLHHIPVNRVLTEQLMSNLKKNPGEWFLIGRKNRSVWARAVATYGKDIQITTRNNDGRDADIYLRSKG